MQLKRYVASRSELYFAAVGDRNEIVLFQAAAFEFVVVVFCGLVAEEELETVGDG